MFEPAGSVEMAGRASDLASGDFDGDGRSDLVVATVEGYEAHFFDEDGKAEESVLVAGGGEDVVTAPVIADFDADGRSDVALVRGESMFVGRGSSERTISPVSYSPFSLEGERTRAVALDVLPEDPTQGGRSPNRGDELLILYEPSDDDRTVAVCATCQSDEIEAAADGRILSTTSIVAGRFDQYEERCGALVLATEGASEIWVSHPCTPTGQWRSDVLQSPTDTVRLPPNVKVGTARTFEVPDAIRSADVNLDGFGDLLVLGSEPFDCMVVGGGGTGGAGGAPPIGGAGGAPPIGGAGGAGGLISAGGAGGILPAGGVGGVGGLVSAGGVGGATGTPPTDQWVYLIPSYWYVAYGVPGGGFVSGTGIPEQASGVCPNVPALGAGDLQETFAFSLPLAVDDLNDDGRVDIVYPGAVLMSIGGPEHGRPDDIEYAAELFAGEWDAAVVADFNLDGFLDLVAASQGGAQLTFAQGERDGALNEFRIDLSAELRGFTIGDFDGDRLKDIAIAEGASASSVSSDDRTETGGASLSVAFGRAYGGPEDPVTMATVDAVGYVVAGRLQMQSHLDAIDDILLSSRRIGEPSVRFALLEGQTDRRLFSPLVLSRGAQDAEADAVPIAVAAGHFGVSPDDRADLAVVTTTNGFGDCPLRDTSNEQVELEHGWLLECDDGADIDVASLAPEPLPLRVSAGEPQGLYAWRYAVATALDLNADGIDEPVVVAPVTVAEELACVDGRYGSSVLAVRGPIDPTAATSAALWHHIVIDDVVVGRFPGRADDSESWAEGSGTGTSCGGVGGGGPGGGDPGVPPCEEVGRLEAMALPTRSRARTADVDLDGDLDLVLLGFEAVSDMPASTGAPVLVVVFNDGSDWSGSVPVVLVRGMADPAIVDFAFVDADAAPGQEIALVTPSAVFISQLVASADGEGTVTFGAATVLSSSVDDNLGGETIAVGDWNGDGVQDLVVGRMAGKAVTFLGVPVLR